MTSSAQDPAVTITLPRSTWKQIVMFLRVKGANLLANEVDKELVPLSQPSSEPKP